MIKLFLNIFLIGVVILSLPQTSHAAELHGINFPDQYTQGQDPMNLSGLSTKNVAFLRVFVSGLYFSEHIQAAEVMSDIAKRIEVYYFHKVPKKRLTKYTIKTMQKNLSIDEFKLAETKFDELDDYFVDLKPGDRFALTYIPGIGTRFEHNGQLRGVIEGEEFGRGIFAVWIGEKPMDRRLRREMLGFKKS